MFDIGFPEMLVIGLIAVIVFGPDRLPEFVRTAARLLNQVRGMVDTAKKDLHKEIGPELANLDVRELDPRSFVRKHLLDGLDDEPVVQVARNTSSDGLRVPYDHEAT